MVSYHTEAKPYIGVTNQRKVDVNGHRKQLRVTEYQQNCFLFLAFIDAR